MGAKKVSFEICLKGKQNKNCTDTPCVVVVVGVVFKVTLLCSVHYILLQEDELIQVLCQENGSIGSDDVTSTDVPGAVG